MSKSREYYDDLIEKGYNPSKALTYTQKFFPEFTVDSQSSQPSAESIAAAVVGILNLQGKGSINDIPVSENAIPINNSSDTGSNENIFKTLYSYVEAFFYVILQPFSDKRIRFVTFGVVTVVLVIIIAFSIPQTQEPIVGTWIKSDGQTLDFEESFVYRDGLSSSSTWELYGSILTIKSVGEWRNQNGTVEEYTIEHEMKVDFSDNGEGMWMKWNYLKVESNWEDHPEGCVFLLKESADFGINDYSAGFEKYNEETPSWCTT